MTPLSPTQAETHLPHVVQQFAQWRQSRPPPRGYRIPDPVWTAALALVEVLSVPHVARQLHLKPAALKRRREGRNRTPPPSPSSPAPHCGEVAPAWRSPRTAVEIQRPDDTRLRLTYRDAAPTLAPLLQTFLEVR